MSCLKEKQKRILSTLLTRNKQGFTITELLISLFISSIVLTTAAIGFINILRETQDVESKTVRMANIQRALNYMQEDIKQGTSITAVREIKDANCNTSGSSVESEYCLRITYPENHPEGIKYIYYAFDDIESGSQIWLKPGVLRWKRIKKDGTNSGWRAIVDGLISVKENQPSVSCNHNSVNWTFHSEIYGTDKDKKGGFRFCVDKDPSMEEGRLVRIFLHGHIIDGSDIITDSIIAFTRTR